MNDDHDHTGAILEAINDQLKAVLEGQAAMASVPQDMQAVKDRLTNIESDIKVIKAAVTDQSQEVNQYGQRLALLEDRAA